MSHKKRDLPKVADIWAQEIGYQYTGYKLSDLREALHELLNLYVKILTKDPFTPEEVDVIGRTLVEFNFTQHVTLDRTLFVLSHDVLGNFGNYDPLVVYPRLMDLQRVIATSYCREIQIRIRKQQESIRLSMFPNREPLPPAVSSPLDALSPRQLQILKLLVAGKRNLEIAQELSITVGTVGQHLSTIYRTLHVRGRTEAKAKAKEWNLD